MKRIILLLIISSLFFVGCVQQIPQQPSSQERSLQIKEAISEIQVALDDVNKKLLERGLELASAELTTNIKMVKGGSGNINIWVLKQSYSATDSSEDSIKITLKPPTLTLIKDTREPINVVLRNAILDAINGTTNSGQLEVEKLEITLNLISTHANEGSAASPKIVPLASLNVGTSSASSKTSGMTLKMTFDKL